MTSTIEKLAATGGQPIRRDPPDMSALVRAFGEEVAHHLRHILEIKNGFYAFEGALHVLSDLGTDAERGVIEWNREDLWRQDYQGMADNAVFFAEDVFGVQFCIHDGSVATFDPETGGFDIVGRDIDEWAKKILADYNLWTGYSLAHAWQVKYGPIPCGTRLMPVTPFVLGGEFETTNVRAVDAVEGMTARAAIAVQIRDLPDGAQIKLRVVD